ncbi:hypothetical protein DIPPA_14296 [Diplonema papillatum]|nr:hypothetical protein DIPPA_14296 [Diplonema papillatum]
MVRRLATGAADYEVDFSTGAGGVHVAETFAGARAPAGLRRVAAGGGTAGPLRPAGAAAAAEAKSQSDSRPSAAVNAHFAHLPTAPGRLSPAPGAGGAVAVDIAPAVGFLKTRQERLDAEAEAREKRQVVVREQKKREREENEQEEDERAAPRKGPRAVKPGDWECPQCNWNNFASNKVCFRRDCDAIRPLTKAQKKRLKEKEKEEDERLEKRRLKKEQKELKKHKKEKRKRAVSSDTDSSTEPPVRKRKHGVKKEDDTKKVKKEKKEKKSAKKNKKEKKKRKLSSSSSSSFFSSSRSFSSISD